MGSNAFDLTTTYAHLGLGARVYPLSGFTWSEEYLAGYAKRFESDGNEGRLVMIGKEESSWTSWERHPAGEELVVQLSGSATLFQEIDGAVSPVELASGMAVINPPGVWHTADVHEPGRALYITPGRGTEHRPR